MGRIPSSYSSRHPVRHKQQQVLDKKSAGDVVLELLVGKRPSPPNESPSAMLATLRPDPERSEKRAFFHHHGPLPTPAALVRGVSLHAPPVLRFSINRLSLVLLVLQNSALIVTMHYSRVMPVDAGRRRYFPSTAIVLVEILKLAISLAVVVYNIRSSTSPHQPAGVRLGRRLARAVCTRDSWKLAVPAALWTLQNFIVYVAVSNLDPPTFQVTYQLKILTTVVFSILLLKKSVSARQWLALLLLTVGVATVQADGRLVALSALVAEVRSRFARADGPGLARQTPIPPIADPPPVISTMSGSRGLLAVVAASIISGLTGVYFEKVLKETSSAAVPATLWTRNVQLSFFSLFPAVIGGVLWQDGREIARHGFFAGYSPVVWLMVALQAGGGLIVAVCISYADNIAKNFAASVSIVCSCVASAMLFGSPVTANFTSGTAIVLLAVYLYNVNN